MNFFTFNMLYDGSDEQDINRMVQRWTLAAVGVHHRSGSSQPGVKLTGFLRGIPHFESIVLATVLLLGPVIS